MTRPTRWWTTAALGLFLWMGCTSERTIPETAFRAIQDADWIEVRTTTDFLLNIREKRRVKPVADFLVQFPKDWKTRVPDAPLPDLIFNFYKGEDTKLMSFGIDDANLTTGESQMIFHPITPEERDQLLMLLQIKELKK